MIEATGISAFNVSASQPSTPPAIDPTPVSYTHLDVYKRQADAFAEDIQLARDAGMNGHLAKPLNMNALRKEIQRQLITAVHK